MNDNILPEPENSTTLGSNPITIPVTPAYTFTNNTDTGFYVDGSGNLSISVGGVALDNLDYNFDFAGVNVNRQMIRDYLESQYVTNKITKEQLVEYLKKYYNQDGLNMAEEIEKMETAKENFIKQLKESL